MVIYGTPSFLIYGPHELNSENIDLYADKEQGAYALGTMDDDEPFETMYVGRSDDVNRRLHEHLRKLNKEDERYIHFCCNYFDAKRAYEVECILFHKYWFQLDNEEHPNVDDVNLDWKCPVKTCPKSK